MNIRCLVLLAALPFYGCSSMLYGKRGWDADDQAGCPGEEKCRFYTKKQLVKTDSFASGTVYTMYRRKPSSLLLELTPLGFFGFLSMPHAKIPDEYEVWVDLTFTPPVDGVAPSKRRFIVKEGGSESFMFQFNGDYKERIQRQGVATKYTPSTLTLSVSCAKGTCTVISNPAIIKSDGTVGLKKEEVRDETRLAEIEAAAREERQRSAVQERKAAAFARNLKKRQDQECPVLYMTIQGANTIGQGGVADAYISQHGLLGYRKLIREISNDFQLLKCGGWVQQRALYGADGDQ